MSRSRRTARAEQAPAPRGVKALFFREAGGLRTPWLLLVSLAALALATTALQTGLNAIFDALFRAWNLRADNVMYAPGWARALYAWRGSLIALLSGAALIALCPPLRRLWGARDVWKDAGSRWYLLALTGFAAALLVALLSLIPDSSRLEWPLSAPRFTAALPLLGAFGLVGVLAEERFVRGVLLDGLAPRWGRAPAIAIACAVFFVLRSGWSGGPVYALNALLLGLCGCLLYERAGLWASALFRWCLEACCAFLLGFGGGDAAVYRLYGVSETLLTGGDRGPLYGLWLSLMLAALALWTARRRCSGCKG